VLNTARISPENHKTSGNCSDYKQAAQAKPSKRTLETEQSNPTQQEGKCCHEPPLMWVSASFKQRMNHATKQGAHVASAQQNTRNQQGTCRMIPIVNTATIVHNCT
jgi:hypothetical protein